MNEQEKEVERLLAKLGFPSMIEMDLDTKILINNFLQTGNPTLLLGIVLKILKSENDNVIALNDYFNTKSNYVDFKRQTIETINRQTELIKSQSELIAKMAKDQEDAIAYLETGKRPKNPTQH